MRTYIYIDEQTRRRIDYQQKRRKQKCGMGLVIILPSPPLSLSYFFIYFNNPNSYNPGQGPVLQLSPLNNFNEFSPLHDSPRWLIPAHLSLRVMFDSEVTVACIFFSSILTQFMYVCICMYVHMYLCTVYVWEVRVCVWKHTYVCRVCQPVVQWLKTIHLYFIVYSWLGCKYDYTIVFNKRRS